MGTVAGDEQIGPAVCRGSKDGRVLVGQGVGSGPFGLVGWTFTAHGQDLAEFMETGDRVGVLDFEIALGLFERVRGCHYLAAAELSQLDQRRRPASGVERGREQHVRIEEQAHGLAVRATDRVEMLLLGGGEWVGVVELADAFGGIDFKGINGGGAEDDGAVGGDLNEHGGLFADAETVEDGFGDGDLAAASDGDDLHTFRLADFRGIGFGEGRIL
jgi:hypothetical protein